MKHLIAAVALSCIAPAPVGAQWLNYRTPNVPRAADGTVNLQAATPRTADGRPDFSGLWRADAIPRDFRPDASALSPWAKEQVRQRTEEFFKTRPSYQCLPSGPEPTGGMRSIIHTPSVVAILNEDLTYRRIFMDGRTLESAPFPVWMGYSVGKWDDDTLVVESNGFNDRTWLNNLGLPHTEGLRMTERFQRPDFGHMRIEVTLTDPAAYTGPLRFTRGLDLVTDTEMVEAVCEVRGDTWTGNANEVRESATRVSPEILATYVGTYTGVYGGRNRTVDVKLVGGELLMTGFLLDQTALIPQSETTFTSTEGLSYVFIRNAQGTVTAVEEVHSSGNYRYNRQR
jgi:hypothetical protein